jgi:hypothetical protein
MAGYLRREAARLRGEKRDDLLAGRIAFGPPPQQVGALTEGAAS